MKKVQYVEAMVRSEGRAEAEECVSVSWAPEDLDAMDLAIKVLRELTTETPLAQWLEAIKSAGSAWNDLESELNAHECDCGRACEAIEPDDDPIPFAPLGGVVSIRREVDRHWLPGDELAILKLSDLRELIGERERNDQLCYYVTEEAK